MDTHAKKTIGVVTATIVGMNAMIGAGIFSVPAALGAYVGPAGLLTYAFVILAVWCMGSSMARLAQLYPQEGSFYTYAYQWGGHTAGLIAAGAYLIGLIIAMGLLIQITGDYLHVTFPSLSPYVLSVLTLVALLILNSVGVTLSQVGQMILICCTVLPILLTTCMCLYKGNIQNFSPFMPYGWTNIFTASKQVIFGFFGFECAASLFKVVENPRKNVPRALLYAIALVGVLYMLFVGSIIFAVPLAYFTDPKIPLSQILALIFPGHPWLLQVIHFSILSAIIGTVHSMIWSSSELLMAYLKKCSSAPFKSIRSCIAHQKGAVWIIGACIFLTFSTIKSMNLFFSFTDVFIVFAFIMSMITLLVKKESMSVGQNIKTILGLITACIIFCIAAKGVFLELGLL